MRGGFVRAQGVLALCLAVLFVSPAVWAANVVIGNGSGTRGDIIRLPATLTNGSSDTVAGLQFDVVFDPGLLRFSGVNPGAAATAAGKTVSESIITPGRVRVVVSGFNQTAIADGEVASVVFEVYPTTPQLSSSTSVNIEGLIVSDPSGNAVAATSANGTVALDFTSLPVDSPIPLTVAALFCLGTGIQFSRKERLHGIRQRAKRE